MRVFYNEKTKGFYQTDIHQDIPSESIEVSDEYRWELVRGQSSGMVIAVDNNGYPILSDKITHHNDLVVSERSWRDKELRLTDFEINKLQDGDSKSVSNISEWRAYRKSLRRWPESKDFPDKSKRPVRPN